MAIIFGGGMRDMTVVRPLLIVIVGALLGGGIVRGLSRDVGSEVDHLDQIVSSSQSHSMADVGFHFANLWFAAEKENWPLASFYFDEGLSHIRWTIRIRPIRRDPDGNPVDLQAIYDGFANGVFDNLEAAIDARDPGQFQEWYRTSLESCYSCHKSSGKPYLRPMMPQVPGASIINPDPEAAWPQ